VVIIDAGAKAFVGQRRIWSKEASLDLVITMVDGFGYSVKGEVYRDHNQSVWTGRNLEVRVKCPPNFKGTFHFFMNDQEELGRAVHIYFCGQDKGFLSRYDRGGVWLEYKVTPEMAESGEWLLDLRTLEGPDVRVQKITLNPD
jgi:hypothetical protein